MSSRFAERILLDGHLVVTSDSPLTQSEIETELQRTLQIEKDYRETLPGTPPEVDRDALRWSLVTLFQIAQSLVFPKGNSLPLFDRNRGLSQEMAPEVCYSVDLFMRFLPELFRLASSMKRQETLSFLKSLARDWPLSTVGIHGVVDDALASAWQPADWIFHPSLQGIYVDRIIRTQDLSRLNDPVVCEAVAAALGMYPEFAPRISKFLADQKEATTNVD